jgi:hypothetical protein
MYVLGNQQKHSHPNRKAEDVDGGEELAFSEAAPSGE